MQIFEVKIAKSSAIEQKQKNIETITKEAVNQLNEKQNMSFLMRIIGQLHSLKFDDDCGMKGTE